MMSYPQSSRKEYRNGQFISSHTHTHVLTTGRACHRVNSHTHTVEFGSDSHPVGVPTDVSHFKAPSQTPTPKNSDYLISGYKLAIKPQETLAVSWPVFCQECVCLCTVLILPYLLYNLLESQATTVQRSPLLRCTSQHTPEDLRVPALWVFNATLRNTMIGSRRNTLFLQFRITVYQASDVRVPVWYTSCPGKVNPGLVCVLYLPRTLLSFLSSKTAEENERKTKTSHTASSNRPPKSYRGGFNV